MAQCTAGAFPQSCLNIPGDEPALMTTLDGYPMAKNGRAGDALVLSGVASFVGAMLATIGLMLLAPILARVAFLFGPAEYFALYMLAFSTLGGIASNNQRKAALAACIGLGIAMIGLDNSTGMPRFYRRQYASDGWCPISWLQSLGCSLFRKCLSLWRSHGKSSAIGVKLDKITIPFKEIARCFWTMIRSTAIGFTAGILPRRGCLPRQFPRLHGRKVHRQRQQPVRQRRSTWRCCSPKPVITLPPVVHWYP